jgi:hypothetical protein
MNRVRGLFRFLWDFVVGDDWRIAVAVTSALLATLVLSNNGVTAWWLLPAAVALTLALSVYGAARNRT